MTNTQISKQTSGFHRAVSLFVLTAFVSTNFVSLPAYAVATADGAVVQKVLPDNLLSIKVPEALGKIQEVFQASSPRLQAAEECLKPAACSLQPVVILIQDAHAIPEAQRNIQKLIGYFQKEYGIHLVALEGAASQLDPQIFKSFPDKEILKKTFEEYFEKGELSGTSAAAIFNECPAIYQGIEDWNLYEEGLGFYLGAMRAEATLLERLQSAESKLQEEKQRHYSPELLEVDRILRSFRTNHSDLVEVLKGLAKVRKPESGTELNLVVEEIGRDKENQSSIEIEVRKFAKQMKSQLEHQTPFTVDVASFNQKYQEFQTSRISPEAFAVFLKEISGDRLRFSGKLARLVQNHKRMRDIEGTMFFREFENYSKWVKQSLFKNNKQRQLDARTRELELLEKLVKLELSREDWKEIEARDYRPETGDQGRVTSDSWLVTRDLFGAHLGFYKNAEKRDQIFLINLRKLMELQTGSLVTGHGSRVTDSAILVAGGFHTEGLAAKLKEKGISYMIVMPQMDSIPEHSVYREQMKGDVSWKDYFRVENGKIDFYKAFVRGARDRLLGMSRESWVLRKQEDQKNHSRLIPQDSRLLLKAWRDQIIRDLVRKEQTVKVREYTQFMDELAQNNTKPEGRAQWQIKMERFIEGLRELDTAGQFTKQNILKLFNPSTRPADAVNAALANGDGASLAHLAQIGLSGHIFEKLAEERSEMRGDSRSHNVDRVLDRAQARIRTAQEGIKSPDLLSDYSFRIQVRMTVRLAAKALEDLNDVALMRDQENRRKSLELKISALYDQLNAAARDSQPPQLRSEVRVKSNEELRVRSYELERVSQHSTGYLRGDTWKKERRADEEIIARGDAGNEGSQKLRTRPAEVLKSSESKWDAWFHSSIFGPSRIQQLVNTTKYTIQPERNKGNSKPLSRTKEPIINPARDTVPAFVRNDFSEFRRPSVSSNIGFPQYAGDYSIIIKNMQYKNTRAEEQITARTEVRSGKIPVHEAGLAQMVELTEVKDSEGNHLIQKPGKRSQLVGDIFNEARQKGFEDEKALMNYLMRNGVLRSYPNREEIAKKISEKAQFYPEDVPSAESWENARRRLLYRRGIGRAAFDVNRLTSRDLFNLRMTSQKALPVNLSYLAEALGVDLKGEKLRVLQQEIERGWKYQLGRMPDEWRQQLLVMASVYFKEQVQGLLTDAKQYLQGYVKSVSLNPTRQKEDFRHFGFSSLAAGPEFTEEQKIALAEASKRLVAAFRGLGHQDQINANDLIRITRTTAIDSLFTSVLKGVEQLFAGQNWFQNLNYRRYFFKSFFSALENAVGFASFKIGAENGTGYQAVHIASVRSLRGAARSEWEIVSDAIRFYAFLWFSLSNSKVWSGVNHDKRLWITSALQVLIGEQLLLQYGTDWKTSGENIFHMDSPIGTMFYQRSRQWARDHSLEDWVKKVYATHFSSEEYYLWQGVLLAGLAREMGEKIAAYPGHEGKYEALERAAAFIGEFAWSAGKPSLEEVPAIAQKFLQAHGLLSWEAQAPAPAAQPSVLPSELDRKVPASAKAVAERKKKKQTLKIRIIRSSRKLRFTEFVTTNNRQEKVIKDNRKAIVRQLRKILEKDLALSRVKRKRWKNIRDLKIGEGNRPFRLYFRMLEGQVVITGIFHHDEMELAGGTADQILTEAGAWTPKALMRQLVSEEKGRKFLFTKLHAKIEPPISKPSLSRAEVRRETFVSRTSKNLGTGRSEVRGWVETFAHKVNDAWLSLDASKINASEQEKRVLELSLNNVRRDLFRLKQLREEIATDVDFQSVASDVLKEAKGSLAELQDYLNGIPVIHRTGSYEQFSRMIRETSRIIAQAAWLMNEIKHKGAISLSAGAVHQLLQLGIDKLRLEGDQPDKFYALAREGRSMIEELSQSAQQLQWGQAPLELEIIAPDTVLLRRIRSEIRTVVGHLTPEENKKIGDWVVGNLIRMKGVVEDPSQEFKQFKARAEEIFKQLLKTAHFPSADEFKLIIIATPEENAAILPHAKTVIITKGLISEMKRYERDLKKPFTEDMLAFILAHEINHYLIHADKPSGPILREEKEAEEDMSYKENWLERFRENAFVHLLNFREEYLADTQGLRLMDRAGFNPTEAVRASEFIRFMQAKEWSSRIRYTEETSRDVDDEIRMLEQIRMEKLRRAFIPSIVDTHPRTQNRTQSLYLLTINRSFRNEGKTPAPLLLPSFDSKQGSREIFWDKMMQKVIRTEINPFAREAKNVAQIEDLAFLYFLMAIAGNLPIYWRSSYDALDMKGWNVADTYLSIPYAQIVSTYLSDPDPEYHPKRVIPAADNIDDEEDEAGEPPRTYAKKRQFLSDQIQELEESLEEGWGKEDEEEGEEDKIVRNELNRDRRRELKALREQEKFMEKVQGFLDPSLFSVVDFDVIYHKINYYRKLFSPWGTWRNDAGLESIVHSRLLMMPFRHRHYQATLDRGKELFEKENPSVKGIRKDMSLWLLFHSYYPNPLGYSLIKKIEKNIKRPEDLLSVLQNLPAKQYDDETLKMAFAGYSGFAYLGMIADYFVPSLYRGLIKNKGFKSTREMIDFLEKVSKELAYFKAVVRLQYEPPMALGKFSLYEELFGSVLELTMPELKTREDFEALARFWSGSRQIPEGAMNQELLVSVLEQQKILGGNLESDIKLLMDLTRGSPNINKFVKVLLNLYGESRENFLALLPLIADTSEFSAQIERLFFTTDSWKAMSFVEKIRSLKDLKLMLKKEQYVGLFQEHQENTTVEVFLEAIHTLEFIASKDNGALSDIKESLGASALAFWSQRPGWVEGSAQHFSILEETVPDSVQKIQTLKLIIRDLQGGIEHYLRAVAALKKVTGEREGTTEQKALTKADEMETEFSTRKRDANYHRTKRKALRDPRELEEENLSPLFLEKLDLGREGWNIAQKSPNYQQTSFIGKLQLIKGLFSDPSSARDHLLEEALPPDVLLPLGEQVNLVQLIHDPIRRIRLGVRFMNSLKADHPVLFESFEKDKETVVSLFPDFSLERDRQLNSLVDRHDSSYSETESLKPYFLEGNEQHSTEEAIVFGTAGMETFRDYMHLTPPRDKAELLLWLLDLQTKPDVVDIMEQSTGYKAYAIKEAMSQSGQDENRVFLQEILLGQNGIFSSGAEDDMQYLLERIFPLVFPDKLQMESTARARLKALFDAVFRFAQPKRRADLLIALANAKYEHKTMPQMVRIFLQAYGSLGVKIGQYLAMRTSLLPQDLREELLNLTDKAEPILKQRIYEAIQAEYGVENPEEIFPKVGKRLGSASFKQVHEGEINDPLVAGGRRTVTIKVLRPAAKKEIMSDLASFEALLSYINEHSAFFGFQLPQDMGVEIRRRTLEEMDFEIEARKQETIRKHVEKRWMDAKSGLFKKNASGYTVQVPRVVDPLTRKTVFADDKAPGLPLTAEKEVVKSHSLSEVSKTLVKEILDQIFYDGFYHADPHPGNIFVSGDKKESLIDFGITGTLSDVNRDRLFDLIQAAMAQDRDKLLDLVVEFYEEMEPESRPQISLDDLKGAINAMLSQGLDIQHFGKSLYTILDEINKTGIRLPGEFYTLLGTLTMMDYWFAKIDNPLFFILPIFAEYQQSHQTRKALNPIRRISAGSLEAVKQSLAQIVKKKKAKTDKADASATKKPSAELNEIWKASIMNQGTRFRIKGKENEEWRLSLNATLMTGGKLLLERPSEKPVMSDSTGFHERAKFILDSWVRSRIPVFENDGRKFTNSDHGADVFDRYFAHMVIVRHPVARKIRRLLVSVRSIRKMQKLFLRFKPYDRDQTYQHYLKSQEQFEKHLFMRYGIPKTDIEHYKKVEMSGMGGLYDSIKKEINQGHVELIEITLTDEGIKDLEILEDDEKWTDFSTFRITKGSRRSEVRENKLRVESEELGVNPETQNSQLPTQNTGMNELAEAVLGSGGIEQARAQAMAGFVRSEVRRVGLGRFAEAFRKAAFEKINENSVGVNEWTVQAVQYLTKHWSELLSAEGEENETFTLGLHLLGGDDPLTVESFVEALLREGVPGGLKRIIATGNPKAIVPFQKQIEKAELTLATVRNPDQVKGLESYIPILSKGAKNPSRNPDVVNVGVDSGTVNPESWNPVLGVGESGSQVALALMLLRRIPDLKGVSRAEVRTLLKQISNQLFPGLEGEEILQWEIQDSSAGGLQLSLNINRSDFMQYVTDLAAQLKARSEIRKAA